MSTRVQPGKTAAPFIWHTNLAQADYVGIAQPGLVAQPLTVYVSGTASTQMTSVYLYGVSSRSGYSTNGTVTLALSDAAGTRTVDVYNNAAKTNKLATGTSVGDGTVTLAAQGTYGVYGSVAVVYTGAEDATATVFDDDARLFVDHVHISAADNTDTLVYLYDDATIIATAAIVGGATSVSLPLGGYALTEGKTLVAYLPGTTGYANVIGWSEVPE
jgi:hypothetical protein